MEAGERAAHVDAQQVCALIAIAMAASACENGDVGDIHLRSQMWAAQSIDDYVFVHRELCFSHLVPQLQ